MGPSGDKDVASRACTGMCAVWRVPATNSSLRLLQSTFCLFQSELLPDYKTILQLSCRSEKHCKRNINISWLLVLYQHDNCVSSWFVRVHGKARLEGNGRSPWREAQRSPWARTNQPAGRCCGVSQPRCSACQGLRHSLRTAPYCETPQKRWIRNYHVDRALGLGDCRAIAHLLVWYAVLEILATL